MTQLTVRAKGHWARRVQIDYVRHLGTLTGAAGTSNVDRDVYRVVATGHEFVLATPDDARFFPACMRVRSGEAPRFGLRPRA
jgi:hypothetical protein